MTNFSHPAAPSPADALVDRLSTDLDPVRRLSPAAGIAIVGCAALVVLVLVAGLVGLREDLMDAQPAGIVLLRAGLLALLGAAALAAAIDLARPVVGRSAQRGMFAGGWMWALAATGLFPVMTIIVTVSHGGYPMDELMSPNVPWCLGVSLASAGAIGTALTLWMRRGAVVRPEQAAWMVGLCAGALGTMIYSLHCPSVTVTYIGLWYTLAVTMCTLAGRLIVAPLLRW